MDIFSYNYSDLLPLGSPECSSASDGTANGCCPANFSDGEVKLASSHPKKRAGRKKFRETRHPVYRGVRLRDSGKWVCEVREPYKKSRIWLGTFPTLEMAARAHDVAAIALRGRKACLNFADSAWRLPIPASADAKDIQKSAAEAAFAFRPRPNGPACSGDVVEEKMVTLPENAFYMDEDAVFGMQELLADMAEGMMLAPPQHQVGDGYTGNDVEFCGDLSLWSYSF